MREPSEGAPYRPDAKRFRRHKRGVLYPLPLSLSLLLWWVVGTEPEAAAPDAPPYSRRVASLRRRGDRSRLSSAPPLLPGPHELRLSGPLLLLAHPHGPAPLRRARHSSWPISGSGQALCRVIPDVTPPRLSQKRTRRALTLSPIPHSSVVQWQNTARRSAETQVRSLPDDQRREASWPTRDTYPKPFGSAPYAAIATAASIEGPQGSSAGVPRLPWPIVPTPP